MKLPKINKGVQRLLIIGYLLCIGKVALMHNEPLPQYVQNASFNDPFFAEANAGHRAAVSRRAVSELASRKKKTYYYLLGYPLVVVAGLWIYAGFAKNRT